MFILLFPDVHLGNALFIGRYEFLPNNFIKQGGSSAEQLKGNVPLNVGSALLRGRKQLQLYPEGQGLTSHVAMQRRSCENKCRHAT